MREIRFGDSQVGAESRVALRMTRTSAEWKRLDSVGHSATQTAAVDIEALTESSKAGPTVQGDFLYAEEIDDGKQSR